MIWLAITDGHFPDEKRLIEFTRGEHNNKGNHIWDNPTGTEHTGTLGYYRNGGFCNKDFNHYANMYYWRYVLKGECDE